MNIAILGAGHIAQVMAKTLNGMKLRGDNVSCYAVASRDIKRAQEFAGQYGFNKAYGSYLELVQDPDIDLVYIATPHSHHAQHMLLCIENAKPVLCEKAFTKNAVEAQQVFKAASAKNILVTEAIWTRYQPSRQIINGIISSGIIGKVTNLTANLHYSMAEKERIVKPELAGGALLDVGVYTLNFAFMHFGTAIERIESSASLMSSGVDGTNAISIYYKDGRTALLSSGVYGRSDRQGVFYGEKGYIIVENINNPQSVSVYDFSDRLLKKITVPTQITGYEYQVLEACSALEKGLTECESMTHEQTLYVMQVMDSLRQKWGVVYPGEENIMAGEVK